jgi:hypothetical protein
MVFFLLVFYIKLTLLSSFKQKQRSDIIAALPIYHEPLTSSETSLIKSPLLYLVSSVQLGETKPISVLRAFGKQALKVHAQTNCLTEIMLSDAGTWAENVNLSGPLAGIPGTRFSLFYPLWKLTKPG